MPLRLLAIAVWVPLFAALPWRASTRGHAAARSAAVASPAGPAASTRVLRGRVLLPDDGSPIVLRVHVATLVHEDSVDVDRTGAFVLPIPSAHCDSADIRIEAREGFPRRYHTVLLRVPIPVQRDSTAMETLRVVLVPTSHAVAGGTYAGTVVPISVDAALAPAGERARYWRVSRAATSRGVPIGWPEERFPLPVAVAGRVSELRRVDSAAFWAIARQLERDVGRTLFRPISLDSARSEGWSINLSLDGRERTPGITFITHDGQADLFDATIVIRASPLLSDERVVTHELVHALGFGHAVGWYSVMNSPFQAAPRVTASDVAYAQLFYRLRRMFIEQRATHGILESATATLRGRVNACASANAPADAGGQHRPLLQAR